MSPGPSFTYADYEAIIDAAQSSGYRFAKFTDPDPVPGERVVYVRHDVDNCLESALRMAELEERRGAVSTYLVLVRSENYNPFTAANAERIGRIRALGHEVGLHFVGGQEPDVGGSDLESRIRDDARLLEQIVHAPVRVFSFHNPTESVGSDTEPAGLINAYAGRFFADACYLSDSNMRWRGSPAEILESREHDVVQILVHPLSYRAGFRTDRDVLLWFLREKVRELLTLNVEQNRALRETGVTMTEVASFIAGESSRP